MNEDLHDSELGLHSASQSEKSTKKKEEVLELPFGQSMQVATLVCGG